MRKYVVPIAALVGIALLSPRSDAANLIIKSRLGTPGHNVSLPVSVTAVGGTTQLWGLDFGLTFDGTKLTVGTDPGGNGSAFSPQTVGSSTEVPVVVSGTTFVGTGATNPNLYVGIVRGTSAFTTTSNATTGAPTGAIGLLRLAVPAAGVKGTTVALAVPANYNVANTGDGSTTNSRFGATGATSDATAGSAVAAESITVLTTMPGSTALNAVPLNTVAIGAFPGDVIVATTGSDILSSADYAKLANYIAQKTTLTDYQKVAGDIAPPNGYVPGSNFGGTAGLSYGDGLLSSADYSLLANKIAGKSTPTFPISE